jgi:hypothetical protein
MRNKSIMPTKGKTSISMIHNTFFPVSIELFRTPIMAIMSKKQSYKPLILLS